jgi:proteasome lid subunit RPN8/RPN11
MARRIVVIGNEGVIVIKRRKNVKNEEKETKRKYIEKPKIVIPTSLIQQMEIRVESIFRPDAEDVETTYALTGDSVMEMLHKFTSKEVIKSATPFEIHTKIEAKLKQILEERAEVGKATTVIDIHTHPQGLPIPSDQDLMVFKRAYVVYRKHFENVYFGIHAVSEETKLRRSKPKAEGNRVFWTSINRKHEVAFFDKDGNPVEVEVWT